MARGFTPFHRGGSGEPMVLLHGFSDTWRSWELVLPRLERRHDVLAPTLVGHAGGPPLVGEMTAEAIPDAIERTMDDAGFATAHIVGNSLGGFVALQLAARGRARSVVALAPAGGWPAGNPAFDEMLASFVPFQEQLRPMAPVARAVVASRAGRRRATAKIAVNFDHIPASLLAHLIRGVVDCTALPQMVAFALANGYHLDAHEIACPVRIVWGLEDVVLPYPAAAVRYRGEWTPQADWVELDGVGHCPQLDVPLETAELILGVTATRSSKPAQA